MKKEEYETPIRSVRRFFRRARFRLRSSASKKYNFELTMVNPRRSDETTNTGESAPNVRLHTKVFPESLDGNSDTVESSLRSKLRTCTEVNQNSLNRNMETVECLSEASLHSELNPGILEGNMDSTESSPNVVLQVFPQSSCHVPNLNEHSIQLLHEQTTQFCSAQAIPDIPEQTIQQNKTIPICPAQMTKVISEQTTHHCPEQMTLFSPEQTVKLNSDQCFPEQIQSCHEQLNQICPTKTVEFCAGQKTQFCPEMTNPFCSEQKSTLCPVCLMEKTTDEFPYLQSCEHRTCRDCLRRYIQMAISESRISIPCPECAELFHPNDIQEILEDSVMMLRYETYMLRRVMAMDPDARWCPAPDCGYVVIASDCASCPRLKCERPGCGTAFCYHCRQTWHADRTCDAVAGDLQVLPSIQSAFRNENDSRKIHFKTGDLRPCPRCKHLFVKLDSDGSCNEMICTCCGTHFCWQCLQEISGFHFFGPSGCTYYGRKPWSKKKQILIQLGILIGAPFAIVLAVTVAAPTMMVIIPAWVGWKIFSNYEGKRSRHKRNLAIAGSVTASVVAAPIITGLAVALAMPGVLAYVYGVVPLSLLYTCLTPASTV